LVPIFVVVGGIVMLWAEKRNHVVSVEHVDDMAWSDALKIGFVLLKGDILKGDRFICFVRAVGMSRKMTINKSVPIVLN